MPTRNNRNPAPTYTHRVAYLRQAFLDHGLQVVGAASVPLLHIAVRNDPGFRLDPPIASYEVLDGPARWTVGLIQCRKPPPPPPRRRGRA